MIKALSLLLLGALGAAGCQQASDKATPPAAAETTAPAATPAPDSTGQITTAAQALSAVNFYLQEMPEGGEYDFDSATAREAAAHWLVLVPSIPGDGRKPNTAAFEVAKKTGEIQVQFTPRPGQ